MATVEERLMKVEEGFIKVVDLLEKHSELLSRGQARRSKDPAPVGTPGAEAWLD